MLEGLIKILKLPELSSLKSLNVAQATLLHREIIKNKPFLHKLYLDFYKIFQENIDDIPKGMKIELGSGGGFLKEVINDVITSEVVNLPDVDHVFSAEKIPFPNESVSAFIILDTLHHIKHPENFFSEALRCLKKDGKVVMIEPTNSFLARFFYKFHHEKFDAKTSTWEISGQGRLSDANLALPWIIFVRDREKFQNNYPDLKILYVKKTYSILLLVKRWSIDKTIGSSYTILVF